MAPDAKSAGKKAGEKKPNKAQKKEKSNKKSSPQKNEAKTLDLRNRRRRSQTPPLQKSPLQEKKGDGRSSHG